MTSEQALPGMRVRVMDHYRAEERRGLMGTVVGRYGEEEHIAVDVRLVAGEYRLFWPGDLEEIPPRRRLGGASCSVEKLRDNSGLIHPASLEVA